MEVNWLKRFLRHVWMSPLIVKRQFPSATLDAIESAVRVGERRHRGQVRLVVEAELETAQLWHGVTARERAVDVFANLRVWDTEENNGVLIYVLLADRKVEIVADRGIDRHVGGERWAAICKEMELHFRRGDYAAGSVHAIEKIAEELAFYYPRLGEQANEQSDRPLLI